MSALLHRRSSQALNLGGIKTEAFSGEPRMGGVDFGAPLNIEDLGGHQSLGVHIGYGRAPTFEGGGMSSHAVAKPSVETTVLHDGLLTYGAPHMPSGRCGTLGETPYNARPEGHMGGQAIQSGYAVPNAVPDTGSRRENNTSRTSQTLPAQQLVTANQVASGQLSCSPCVPHASARVESERDVERNCVLGDMFQGYQTRGPNGVHMLGQYPAGGGAGSAPLPPGMGSAMPLGGKGQNTTFVDPPATAQGDDVYRRGMYSPGDRTFWELPSLPPFDAQTAPLQAGDWVESIRPMMCDLAPYAGNWWDYVLGEAGRFYSTWQSASPLTKAQVRAVLPLELQSHRYARLENRATAMLLKSLPETLREELLASRGLNTVNIIFMVYKMYQPGGLCERSMILSFLHHPGVASSCSHAVVRLRKWFRWAERAVQMGTSVPDVALLVAGLDELASPLLAALPTVQFRVNIVRTQCQIDHSPTFEGVQSFARSLQAKMEAAAIGQPEETLPKKQRLALLDGKGNGVGNGGGNQPQSQKTGNPKGGQPKAGEKGKGPATPGTGESVATSLNGGNLTTKKGLCHILSQGRWMQNGVQLHI